MTTKDNGGPAFPGPSFTKSGHPNGHSMGMTLRDWFAGRALAGLSSGHDNTGTWSWTPEGAASTAYAISDAMLAERAKQ